MRPFSFTSFTCLALLVAGCAANSTSARVGSKTPIDCGQFFIAGSALAADIAANGLKPHCEKTIGPQGGFVEDFGIAGVKSTDQGTERGPLEPGALSFMMVYRYYGWDKPMDPLKASDLKPARNFRFLPNEITLQNASVEALGRIFTFELPGLPTANACVTADTVNTNGSRSRVELCRAIQKPAKDEDVLEMATKIARTDFAAIKP